MRKKICRLNARQLEMARALGMNPKKLPGLRPSPQQRWKLPVGEFIEELLLEALRRQSLDQQRACRSELAQACLHAWGRCTSRTACKIRGGS